MSNDVVGRKRFATLSLCVVLALTLFTVGWWIGAMSPVMYTLVIGVLALAAVVILRLGAWAAALVLVAHLYLAWYLGNMVAGITLDWLFLGIILLFLIVRASGTNETIRMAASAKAHAVRHREHAALDDDTHDEPDSHRDQKLSVEDDRKEGDVEEVSTKKMPETPKPRQFLPHIWLPPLTPNGRRLLKSPFPFGDPGKGHPLL
jgi:hypothetical protein